MLPAAVAGSTALELRTILAPRGLLLRRGSVSRADGERERLSNRDGLRGSGSVWSNRERFDRFSSSAMKASGEVGCSRCLGWMRASACY